VYLILPFEVLDGKLMGMVDVFQIGKGKRAIFIGKYADLLFQITLTLDRQNSGSMRSSGLNSKDPV